MKISHEQISEIKDNNNIVDVISPYVKLTQKGNRYSGLCPFHNEKSPSFYVDPAKGFYHCFGCGASGDVFSFLMEYNNYDFMESAKILAEKANISLVHDEETHKKNKQQEEQLIEIHTKAARFYYNNLQSEKGLLAREYLDKRKVTSSIRTKFGLGYAGNSFTDLYDFLKKEGYDDDLLLKSGLINSKNGKHYDKFISRLMFPIFDIRGRVIAFGGRIIGEGQPKYLNSPETPIFNKSQVLYNLNYAKSAKTREFVMVEGYMDVIAVYQAGIKNVVATLGTAFNESHATVLKRSCDTAYILFDSDEAGVKATERAIPVMVDKGIKTRIVSLYDSKDPDEFLQKYGVAKFRECLNNAVDNNVFEIKQLVKKYDINSPQEKIELLGECVKVINKFDNIIERDVYIKEMANLTKVDEEAIRQEVNKSENMSETLKQKTIIRNSKVDKVPKRVKLAVIDVVYTLINRPQYNQAIMNILPSKYIADEDFRKLFELIYEKYEKNEQVVLDELTNYFYELDSRTKIFTLIQAKQQYEDEETEIHATNDAISVILSDYIDVNIANATTIEQLEQFNNLRRQAMSVNITNK